VKGGKHRSPPTVDRNVDIMELAVLYRPKPKEPHHVEVQEPHPAPGLLPPRP
jgi:hypothetical protein